MAAPDLLKVDKPVIGKSYHLAWAKTGCVWRLVSMDEMNNKCVMITPSTHKEITAKISDLRHLRKEQFKLQSK
jgi:hypothetical protein